MVKAIKNFFKMLGAIAAALFDPLVVVTMMTTLALIIGVLAYASPQNDPKRWVVILCFAIGFIGLVTIGLQVRALLKRKSIREKLAEFLDEGQALLATIRTAGVDVPAASDAANAWAKKVETFLADDLGRAYIHRFRSRKEYIAMTWTVGTEEQNGLYAGVFIRVANLERFAGEIGIN